MILLMELAFGDVLRPPNSQLTSLAQLISIRAVSSNLLYAQGTQIMRNGTPIQLFGVNDDMAFVYTYWGSTYVGKNSNFPAYAGTISGVSTPDAFWQAHFRFFLHYQQSAGAYGSPAPNLFRVTVGWDFGSEDSYVAWSSNPAGYFADFDAMVKWAKAAGVYLVPMLMESPMDRSYMWQYFDIASARYAHLVAFERALMSKYANEPTVAIWDVFNEADMAPYWPTHGNFAAFKAWEQRLVTDVRSATPQLLTVGHAMTSASSTFPNDPWLHGFNQTWYNAFSAIVGVNVSHIHVYGTAEDQYLIDWMVGWTTALGKPMFTGELGYNAYPSPVGAPYPIGHWPWYTNVWLAAKVGPVAEMTWLNNGKGAYADYPYMGPLPNYPPANSTPPPPTYQVSFPETGLPSGTSWSLTLAGTTRTSTTDTIAFMESNGTYGYTVGTVSGYTVSPSSGSVTVNGAGVNRPITFTPLPTIDMTPPAAVTDLRVTSVAQPSLTLAWTAPTDPDNAQATRYDFRYSSSGPITNTNFNAATHYEITAPRTAGSTESATVVGLQAGIQYWFAIKTADAVPNWSNLSNSPSAVTQSGSRTDPPPAGQCWWCLPIDVVRAIIAPLGFAAVLLIFGTVSGLSMAVAILRRSRREAGRWLDSGAAPARYGHLTHEIPDWEIEEVW
jgi:hypothetical protein